MKQVTLIMCDDQKAQLMASLFKDDGNEAVAFLLCGTTVYKGQQKLLVHQVIDVPDTAYKHRTIDEVRWDTAFLIPYLDKLEVSGFSLVKCHSHTQGIAVFSPIDDTSDQAFLPSCYQWNPNGLHASVVFTETSATGRVVTEEGDFLPISEIISVGETIRWLNKSTLEQITEAQTRFVQAFGQKTYTAMSKLRVAVIGASGTGSLSIEALARTGVGEIYIFDPEIVEGLNLNRVLHATQSDADNNRYKATIAAENIKNIGLSTRVVEFKSQIQHPDMIRAIASCHVVIGAVDNRETRQLLTRLSAYYLMPYIDMGVAIRASSETGLIKSISAGIHYIQPGQSFIMRNIFNYEQLREESLARTDPGEYEALVKQKYIKGITTNNPAVMPLNMIAAGMAVMVLIDRIHGIRTDPEYTAESLLIWDHGVFSQKQDPGKDEGLLKCLGLGDTDPILGMPAISKVDAA